MAESKQRMQDQSPSQAEALTPQIQQALGAIRKRNLGVPALLFVAGHQPVAFLAGQTCHLFAPLGVLWGSNALIEWATLLSEPNGGRLLEAYLLEIELLEIEERNGG